MRAAFATEPLLDAGISLKSRYIQELATKDQFKTMLQGRLASCLNQGSETAATFAGNTAKNGRGGKNNPGAEVKPRPQQVRSPAGRQAARRSGSERSQGQKADRSGRVPAKSGAVRSERTAPKAPAAKEMPPALAQFIAEVEKQPGGALKVAPERQAAVAELLRSAGLGSEAVEKLLTDPKVQENGLTAEALKACWLENRPALSASGTEGRSPNLAGRPAAELDRQEIIASPEYQNRWSRLTVPADTWPELRLELQRLGVAPAELAKLEEQVNGQGISLEQVMRLLKEVPDSGAAAAGQASSPGRETGRLEPLAGDEVAAWRQLLQKAGLEPQVLEALGDSQGPGNAEELRQIGRAHV